MSSYFDTMIACLGNPKTFAKFVARQYGYYLDDVGWKIRSQKRLEEFNQRILYPFRELEKLLLADEITSMDFIQECHNLAHDLGNMRIPLKSGKYVYASDNPYLLTY